MTRYAFETITAADALQFAPGDTLTFARGSAAHAAVAFLPAEVGQPLRVSVTLDGRTVVFGPGLAGSVERGVLAFADGSSLLIGDDRSQALAGGLGADGLYGGAGEDFLLGNGGDDLLHGNAGHDTLHGGAGANVIYGGQGHDVIEASAGGEARGSWAHGNLGDDEVVGGAGADTLHGGQGDDLLAGKEGADYLSGDLGDDDILTGSGDDLAFGGAGADTLSSVDGADLLSGGDGDDRLVIYGFGGGRLEGGAGADTLVSASRDASVLSGGAGADRFEVLNSPSLVLAEADRILDWDALDRLGFGGTRGEILPHQYAELVAESGAAARASAHERVVAAGAHRVAAQVGSDVWIFADTNGETGDGAEAAVLLVGRSLADIDWSHFV